MSLRQFAARFALLAFLLVAAAGATVQPAVAVASGGAATQSGGSGPSPATSTAPLGAAGATANAAQDVPPPNTTFRFRLQDDGDARVSVEATYYLDGRNDTRAFEDLARSFERGESEQLGLSTFREAADAASRATGRSMTVRDVERDHRLRERENASDMGTLVLSFTWTNFGRIEGERLYVGDAFNTTSGTWLPGLNARQTLVISPPASYNGVYSAPIGVDNGVARWEGPASFDGRLPYIVYTGDALTTTTRPPSPGTTTAGTSPTSVGPPSNPDGDPILSALPFVLVLLGAGAAAVAVYVLRGSDPGGSGVTTTDDGGDPGSAGGSSAAGSETASGADAATETRESGPGAADETASGAESGVDEGAATAADAAESAEEGSAADDAGAAAGAAGADDAIDEELLSDEERVERLLERNGGRMKQADIVKETGWSNAKVSQLLSSMADEGRIDKLRIGRENLISFPDEDVTDLDSE